MSKVIAFLVLLFISPAAYSATTHTVGASSGWSTGVNYGGWASGQTFATGDSLVFNYGPSHAVDEVNEADYTSCNTRNTISSDSNSPTTISLTTAGTRYFICPRSDHCSQGMKLAVNVTAASTSPAAPSPPSATPGTPTSTSAPPPPAGGSSATSLSGGTRFVGGLLVLAAMLMG